MSTYCFVKTVIHVIRCVIYDTYVYNDLICPYRSRIFIKTNRVLLCYLKEVFRLGDLEYIKYKQLEILNQNHIWHFGNILLNL